MAFSKKQREYLDSACKRWNFKTGATRSGKTYLDYFVIPLRLQKVRGKEGLAVILGVSNGTIQRNIIEPLQKIWGTANVSDINTKNQCFMFGELVYCLGAEKVNQVSKLQGASIKYCYGDEVARWNADVFTMLKSRLDKSYSKFDGALNPEFPTHWLKKFLDSDADIYCQTYTLFDNPFLDDGFVKNLCNEYRGTVYYDRYILGLWKAAEGLVYPLFADNFDNYILDKIPDDIIFAQIGIDFGGNGSAHAFVLTGITKQYKKIVTLEEFYYKPTEKNPKILSPAELEQKFVEFVKMCKSKYKFPIVEVYADSAEQTLIAGLKAVSDKNRLTVEIHNARKGSIIDRIRFYNSLISTHRFYIMRHCKRAQSAFLEARYDSKSLKDERLDNGTTNIDSLDAQEYSTENLQKTILEMRF